MMKVNLKIIITKQVFWCYDCDVTVNRGNRSYIFNVEDKVWLLCSTCGDKLVKTLRPLVKEDKRAKKKSGTKKTKYEVIEK